MFAPPITVQDAIEDAFRPIARDGAALSEIQIRLHKALAALHDSAPDVFAESCERLAREAFERAKAASLLRQSLP